MARGEILKLHKCSCCVNYILSPPKMTMTSALAGLQSTPRLNLPDHNNGKPVLSSRLHQTLTQKCLFNVTHLYFVEGISGGLRGLRKPFRLETHLSTRLALSIQREIFKVGTWSKGKSPRSRPVVSILELPRVSKSEMAVKTLQNPPPLPPRTFMWHSISQVHIVRL